MVNDYYVMACAIKSTPFFLTPWWCSSSATASATVVAIVHAGVAGFLLLRSFSFSSLLSYYILLLSSSEMLISPRPPPLASTVLAFCTHRFLMMRSGVCVPVLRIASFCIYLLPEYSIIYYISGLLPRRYDSLASNLRPSRIYLVLE